MPKDKLDRYILAAEAIEENLLHDHDEVVAPMLVYLNQKRKQLGTEKYDDRKKHIENLPVRF